MSTNRSQIRPTKNRAQYSASRNASTSKQGSSHPEPSLLSQLLPEGVEDIVKIMKSAGIENYEPPVIPEILEFVYRYTTEVLEDANSHATNAYKKVIDRAHVKLAIKLQDERRFSPPVREELMKAANIVNSVPLPQIEKSSSGLRQPSEKYLRQPTYRLKTTGTATEKKRKSAAFRDMPSTSGDLFKPVISLFPDASTSLSAVIVEPKPSFYSTSDYGNNDVPCSSSSSQGMGSSSFGSSSSGNGSGSTTFPGFTFTQHQAGYEKTKTETLYDKKEDAVPIMDSLMDCSSCSVNVVNQDVHGGDQT